MTKTLTRFAAVVLVATSASLHAAEDSWQKAIADALGKSGTANPDGSYRVAFPRTDLKVTLDGVPIQAGFALGSWLGFARAGADTMVMGDLVLTPDEVNPVMLKLERGGIQITALHNHLLRNQPFTMYMHVLGHGEPAKLATTLREALAESKTPMQQGAAPASQQSSGLDTAAIERALGQKGRLSGTVFQVSVPRADGVSHAGMGKVPEPLGSANAINFQATGPGKAAITGDFVLRAQEVNPVLRELREHGIEVTALHNHMLDDEPRLFFMHFWANDDAVKLGEGLRAALSKINVAK
jgi:uncharacterized protein DUF1259